MGRPRKPIGDYCIHKRSNRAYARVNGKEVYLGPAHSPESYQRYRSLKASVNHKHPPRVYVLSDGGSALKVGITTNARRNFGGLQRGNDRPLRFVYLFDATAEVEKELHRRLLPFRTKSLREWFQDCGSVRTVIAEAIDRLGVDQINVDELNRRIYPTETADELLDRVLGVNSRPTPPAPGTPRP